MGVGWQGTIYTLVEEGNMKIRTDTAAEKSIYRNCWCNDFVVSMSDVYFQHI